MARILVADDSLTIQKVVSITLSSLPYQLIQAKSEAELYSLLKTDKFDLILLDFGLVEKKSGYDLARDVRKSGYHGPILTLVGTFDSIDESNLQSAQIQDYITKPFESEKFISKCQNLLSASSGEQEKSSTFDLGSIEDLNTKTDLDLNEAARGLSAEDDDTNWVMDSSHETSGVREIDLSQLDEDLVRPTNLSESPKNKLQEDLSGWGIGVPEVIGKEEQTSFVPPKLPDRRPVFQTLESDDDELESFSGSKSSENTDIFHIEDFLTAAPEADAQLFNIKPQSLQTDEDQKIKDSKEEESKLPQKEDLEYPNFSFENSEKPKSKLIPLDQLSPISEDDSDVTDPAFELPQGLNEKLLEQFQSDEDPDKFWAADTTSVKEKTKPQVFSSEKAGIKFDENWEFRTNHIDSQASGQSVPVEATSGIDEDAIVQKIMNKLTPILEAKLKDYCKNSVERIAWEIIPDLAENLIREEIKKIESQT